MAITPIQRPVDPFERYIEAMLAPVPSGRAGSPGLMRAPATDVVETENEIRVTTDLPGFDPDDVDVDLENNVLTLRGEKREEHDETDEKNTWHLVERRYGQFTRSFVLPREIVQDKIEARYHNGVLTVTIPKNETAKRRRISIASGDGRSKQIVQEGEPSGK